MEKNMEVMTPEGTTPTEPVTESAADADVQDETAVDTQPEQQSGTDGEGTTPPPATEEAPTQPTEEVTIETQFNHEVRHVPASEAATIVQKYWKNEPMLDKIRMLAAGCGKSMEEMVDALVEATDNRLREQLLEEAGGNQSVADRLYELEKSKRDAAFTSRRQAEAQAETDARNQLDERLAEEFAVLHEEFPELTDFKAVPKEVVSEAIKKNISLYDSYLRYERKNAKAAAQNAKQQAAAAAASTGSRADNAPASVEDPVIAAALAGLRSAL